MTASRNRLYLTAGALAAILLLGAGPSLAQREPVPCSAFSRNTHGGWTVLAPVMLDLGGRIYSPIVGTSVAAGSMRNGIELSDVLDRQCGNR